MWSGERKRMLNILFLVLMFLIFGKLFGFAIKAAWGISKVICTIVLLPLVLIGLVVMGLIWMALPILLVVGIVSVVITNK